jgi:hypothetical protein
LRLPEPWLSLFSLDHAVNWEAISAIGQIVGALAVVISLIYFAREAEIRRNARAERLASMDSLIRWLGELVAHQHVRELYYRGILHFKSLKGADIVGFSMLMVQWFRIYEEMYYQQLEGHLDPRVWRGAEAGMREMNALPGVQAWWRLHSHWFDEEFGKFINQVQQTAKPPRLYREANPDQ